MATDESESSGLSDESLSYLEEVKKGKPRKFAMICKGTNIVSLVVYKKGSIEKYKKEAKSAGKGQFYFGVIDGRGQDLTFKLAREDGFDSAPVKTQSLKHFLDDGGIKCKPLFEIVDSAPVALDDDDPLVARFLKLRELALQVCDVHPERSAEIGQSVTATAKFLSESEPDQAESQVNSLEQLLKSIGTLAGTGSSTEAQPQSVPPVAPPPPPMNRSVDEAQRQKLQAALTKLVPQLKQAVANHPQRKVELLSPVAEIKRQIETGELDAAKQGLLSVGKLLKEILTTGQASNDQPSPQSSADTAKTYAIRLAAIREIYDQVLAQQLGDTSKYRAVMAYATEQAEAGSYANALKAFDRLQPLLQDALAMKLGKETDVIPEHIVADRKQFVVSRWQQTVSSVSDQIEKVRQAIHDAVPDENADEIADALQAELEVFWADLNQAIVGTEKANVQNNRPLDAALASIKSYRAKVNSSPLLQLLSRASSDLGGAASGVNVSAAIINALNDLEMRLTG